MTGLRQAKRPYVSIENFMSCVDNVLNVSMSCEILVDFQRVKSEKRRLSELDLIAERQGLTTFA
jgi:hypothetical protein